MRVMYPPPLPKHGQGQKNNGHTGSPCLDKPVLARDAQHKETLHTENPPVPHTKHITHKHETRKQRVGRIQHGPHVLTAHQRVQNRNPFHRIEGQTMVAGACSPLDRMYVTPKPAIATFFMATTATTATTAKPLPLGCSTNRNVVVTKRNHHKHDPALLSLCNQRTITKQ